MRYVWNLQDGVCAVILWKFMRAMNWFGRCKYPRITVETLTEDGKIGVFRQWLFDTVTMYFRFLSCLPILLCCYLQKTMSLTKTFDWRFLQILYHSITTKVVAINIQALEEWYRTFSSITPLSLLYHCLVLILVDCVLKKSCYRLSINVKKTDNPFLILK